MENKTKEMFEGKEKKGNVKQKESALGLRYKQQYLPRNEEKGAEDISRWEERGDSDGLMYYMF